jgi:hypothetical protein
MSRVSTSLFMLALMAGPSVAGLYTARVPGIAPLARARGAGCGERLGNNVYRCTVAQEGGGTFTDCLRFASPGAVSDKFDLVTDQLGATLGCTCKAKGKPKRPKFGVSPSFECTGDEDVSFEGKVARSGRKIGKGFAANAAGSAFVFTCKLDPGCAL